MDSTALAVTLLQQGLNALAAAFNGEQRIITHIALGDGGHTPTRHQTGLVNERVRVAVADGRNLGDGRIEVDALFAGGELSFPVREVAFILDNGVTLGVWSHSDNVLFYMTPKTRHIERFLLVLNDVPTGSVTVNQSGVLNLNIAPELVQTASGVTATATTVIKQAMKLMELERQLRSIQQ